MRTELAPRTLDSRRQVKLSENELARKPLDIIESYGPTEILQIGDEEVVLLPSRSVPERYLDKSLWERKVGMGTARCVYSVDQLTTGEDPQLVVKNGEREFTTNPKNLERGTVWWDGPRSNDKPVRLDSSLTEVQTVWEAAVLTELWGKGISAETPQALITRPDGRVSLVVDRIDERYVPTRGKGPTHEELLEKVAHETELSPVDASRYNALTDSDGYTHLIDVNRWGWSPHTDAFNQTIVEAIKARKSELNKF